MGDLDFVGKVESLNKDFCRALTLAGEKFSPKTIQSLPVTAESCVVANWHYDFKPQAILQTPK